MKKLFWLNLMVLGLIFGGTLNASSSYADGVTFYKGEGSGSFPICYLDTGRGDKSYSIASQIKYWNDNGKEDTFNISNLGGMSVQVKEGYRVILTSDSGLKGRTINIEKHPSIPKFEGYTSYLKVQDSRYNVDFRIL